MRKVINNYTGQIVRVGDAIVLPGNLLVKITGFKDEDMLVLGEISDRYVPLTIPFAAFGLRWYDSAGPWEAMTFDDWIHASNAMRERGGHFASHLAIAFQHADGSNQPPLKRAYGQLFFSYLSEHRQQELQKGCK